MSKQFIPNRYIYCNMNSLYIEGLKTYIHIHLYLHTPEDLLLYTRVQLWLYTNDKYMVIYNETVSLEIRIPLPHLHQTHVPKTIRVLNARKYQESMFNVSGSTFLKHISS